MKLLNDPVRVQNINYDNRVINKHKSPILRGYLNKGGIDSFELSFGKTIIKDPTILGENFAKKIIKDRKSSFLEFMLNQGETEPFNEKANFVQRISREMNESGEFKISNKDINYLCSLNKDLLDIVEKLYPQYKNRPIKDIIKLANKYLRHGLNNETFLNNTNEYMRGYLASLKNIDIRIKFHNENYEFLSELINAKDVKNRPLYTFNQIDKLMLSKNGKKIHEILTSKTSDGKFKAVEWFNGTLDSKDAQKWKDAKIMQFINFYNAYEKEIDKFVELDFPTESYKDYLSSLMEFANAYKENKTGYDYILKNAPEVFYNTSLRDYITNNNYKAIEAVYKNEKFKNERNCPTLSNAIELYSINPEGAGFCLDIFSTWSTDIIKNLISKRYWSENTKNLLSRLSGVDKAEFERILHFDESSYKFYKVLDINMKKPDLVNEVLNKFPKMSFCKQFEIITCANKQPKTYEFLEALEKRIDEIKDIEDFVVAYTKDPVFVKKFIHAKNLASEKYRITAINWSQGNSLKAWVDAKAIDKDFVEKMYNKRSANGKEYVFDIWDGEKILRLTKKHKNPKFKAGIDEWLTQANNKESAELYNILDKIEKYENL